MISLAQLWMPIVLSAVLIFVMSSLIHMVFKWHNSDYHGLANEEEVRAALRSSSPAPGLYVLPYCSDFKDIQKPEMQARFREGPVGFLTLRPPGPPTMGAALGQWFVLNLVIASLVGYLACHELTAGAAALSICRLVGLVTFLAYGCGGIINAIWMGKPWASAAKEGLDAAIYAVVSAAAFAWLWPR